MRNEEQRSRNAHPAGSALCAGDRVEVRNRFDGTWSPGFVISGVQSSSGELRYRIKRLSDGTELPVTIAAPMVEATA